MRCPVCGGPLVPDELQFGLYQCAQCGEVEVDEGGAYVRGRFYEFGDRECEDPTLLGEMDATPDDHVPTWEDVFTGDESVSPHED